MMHNNPSPSDLALMATAEGVFNKPLADGLQSLAEKEIMDPSLLWASLVQQMSQANSAAAIHTFNGGLNRQDAEIVKERLEGLLTMVTIAIHQNQLSLQLIEQQERGENVISLDEGHSNDY